MNETRGKFGIFSLFTMIVGIVIGSGIFIKNMSLVSMNGSVTITLISWIISSIIIMAIMISFIEIISITEKNGKQSNMANWGAALLGGNFGRFMGLMMGYVFLPLLMCVLFSYSAQCFMAALRIMGAFSPSFMAKAWTMELTQHVIAIFLLITFTLMNSFSTKPGKLLQNIGTTVKIIPLFLMILIFMVILGIGDIHFATEEEILNQGIQSSNLGLGKILLVFITIPPILFSFDGFLIAGMLSKEAKSKTSYRWALILGLSFIVIIYILYSISTLGLGTVEPSWDTNVVNDPYSFAYGSVNNAIFNTFSNNISLAKGLAITSQILIAFSILIGASGTSLAASRIISDLADNNIIDDPKGKLVSKDKIGITKYCGIYILSLTLMWYVTFGIFDTILYSTWMSPSYSMLAATDYTSNLSCIAAFTIYTMLIVGAQINRFKNKVDVDRNKLFWPASILSVVLMVLVTGLFTIETLLPIQYIFNKDSIGSISSYWSCYVIYLLMFSVYIFVLGWLSYYYIYKRQNINQDVLL